MSKPSPNDVGGDDLYDRFKPQSLFERTAELRASVSESLRDPTEADGWLGILIPAIVTAIALSFVRRWL